MTLASIILSPAMLAIVNIWNDVPKGIRGGTEGHIGSHFYKAGEFRLCQEVKGLI